MISTPAFFSRFAAAMASSWDFPSVNKTRKKGVSDLAPASALMFSSITWSNAWPGKRMQGDTWQTYCLCALQYMYFMLVHVGVPTQKHMNNKSMEGENYDVCLPVNVFPPLYLKFLTASNSCSLVVKLLSCHSVRGSPLYWVRPGTRNPSSSHMILLLFSVFLLFCCYRVI